MTADSPELEAIGRVLAAHADELLALPGVQGVAIGLAADGTTPCLQVLAAGRTPELEARLPRTIEGHPVVIVETGPIRPLEER